MVIAGSNPPQTGRPTYSSNQVPDSQVLAAARLELVGLSGDAPRVASARRATSRLPGSPRRSATLTAGP